MGFREAGDVDNCADPKDSMLTYALQIWKVSDLKLKSQ
jgi:hypothetical protein